jgi:hypothetical protein
MPLAQCSTATWEIKPSSGSSSCASCKRSICVCLELTELQVQCAEEQCVIFVGGNSIPIYEMGFDAFASEHGFNSAVIHSMDGGPNRFVYLHR